MMSSCALAASAGEQMGMTQHFSLLAAALGSIESRSEVLAAKLSASEDELATYKARLTQAETAVARLSLDLDTSSSNQVAQRREVTRLSALLEAANLQAALNTKQLAADLADERLKSEHLRAVRDEALLQRDGALLELSNAYADIEAMQATLADSALYVRQLRRRVSELEQHQQQHQQAANKQQQLDRDRDRDQGVFSLASIKKSIQAAMAEAAAEPEAECKKKIRQLQLRWHPDKNPVLREFATEVTKIINEAVAALHP
eukprot:GHRR01034642.1.p1 GENE.GHRR01034642.1~~GHRR01034642.1.p1  ORF type:complete len:260 (+),score=116.44 GHRR01034642.1:359-1138(+)